MTEIDNNIYKYEDVLSRKDFETIRNDIDNAIDKEQCWSELGSTTLEDKAKFDISQYPLYKIAYDASRLLAGKDFYTTGTYRQLSKDPSVDWHYDGDYINCIFCLYAPKEGGVTEYKNGMKFIPKENQLIVFDGRLMHRVTDTNEKRQTYMIMFHI